MPASKAEDAAAARAIMDVPELRKALFLLSQSYSNDNSWKEDYGLEEDDYDYDVNLYIQRERARSRSSKDKTPAPGAKAEQTEPSADSPGNLRTATLATPPCP